MKCPKCHYLSFDPEPRCRNCGYTLSLDSDLEIHHQAVESEGPLVDLALRDFDEVETLGAELAPAPRRTVSPAAETGRRVRTSTPGPFDELLDSAAFGDDTSKGSPEAPPPLDPSPVEPSPAATPSAHSEDRGGRAVPPATSELPLFVQGYTKDVGPEVAPPPRREPANADTTRTTPAAAPSQPPVGKTIPNAPARPRPGQTGAQRKLGPLDHDLLEGLQEIELAEQRQSIGEARRELQETAADARSRISAAVVDAALLALLATGLVSVTLRWAGLGWEQVQVLPALPLAGFILVIVAGYLFMFTAASGQTVGKMLLGIRVVDAGVSGSDLAPVSLRQAFYREALTIPSVLLCGAGFLPALIGDGRAVHDRLTQTRVVRA
jgi:uncharacterized RDD family membrane protein YckC